MVKLDLYDFVCLCVCLQHFLSEKMWICFVTIFYCALRNNPFCRIFVVRKTMLRSMIHALLFYFYFPNSLVTNTNNPIVWWFDIWSPSFLPFKKPSYVTYKEIHVNNIDMYEDLKFIFFGYLLSLKNINLPNFVRFYEKHYTKLICFLMCTLNFMLIF